MVRKENSNMRDKHEVSKMIAENGIYQETIKFMEVQLIGLRMSSPMNLRSEKSNNNKHKNV